jgi:hypothetical protein
MRTTEGLAVDGLRFGQFAGLPVRAAEAPWDDVLEAAEDGAPLPRRLVGAEAIAGLNRVPAPIASFSHQLMG